MRGPDLVGDSVTVDDVGQREGVMGGQGRAMSRRGVLRGASTTFVTAPALAACGSGSGTGGSGSGTDGPEPSGHVKATLSAADVPVGGGTVLAEQMVVVTQPAEGRFKAFDAVCTHQGCPVQTVTDGTIDCPCHGSRFSVEDGSVVQGPATHPLKSLDATVRGDQVTVT
jgi:Rieske Fe-S protein